MNHPISTSPWQTPASSTDSAEPALFETVLVPHRSLSPAGFTWVMGALAAISLTVGLIFFLTGAWPVIGFLGLDVALIYIALRASYAHAGLTEEIRLTATSLGVWRRWPRGRTQRWSLEPYWARVDLTGPDDAPDALTLSSRGAAVRIGGFLSAAERAALAAQLRLALHRAKSA